MYFSSQNQISTVAKSNFDAQMALNASLLNKTFENLGKFVDLNLTVAKASMEESNVGMQQLISAKDAQEFFSLAAAHAQPTTEKAFAYAHHVANIAAIAHADFTATTQEKIKEMSRAVSELVEDASKIAPAGSENIIAIMRTAIGNANVGFEQMSKTTQQAVDVMEDQLEIAEDHATEGTKKAVRRARK